MWFKNLTLKEASTFLVNTGTSTINKLADAGVFTVGDLMDMTEEQLKEVANQSSLSLKKLQYMKQLSTFLNDHSPITPEQILSLDVVKNIEGIGRKYGSVLYNMGITTLADLRNSFPLDYAHLIQSPYVNLNRMWAWKDSAWLQINQGIDRQYGEILTKIGIRDFTTLLHENPQELLNKIRNYNSRNKIIPHLPSIADVQSWFVLSAEEARECVKGGYLSAKEAAERGWLTVQEAWDAFIEGLEAAVSVATQKMNQAMETATNAVEAAANAIAEGLDVVYRMIKNAFHELFQKILDAACAIGDFVWQHLSSFLDRVVQAANASQSITSLMTELLNNIFEPIRPQVQPLLDLFQTLGNLLERIKEIIGDAVQIILDTIKSFLSGFLPAKVIDPLFALLSVFMGNPSSQDMAAFGNAVRNIWEQFIPPEIYQARKLRINRSSSAWKVLDTCISTGLYILGNSKKWENLPGLKIGLSYMGGMITIGISAWAIAGKLNFDHCAKFTALSIACTYSSVKELFETNSALAGFIFFLVFTFAMFVPLASWVAYIDQT